MTALDPDRNTVVVGPAEEMEADRLWAEQVNLISIERLEGPLPVTAKIRHSHVPAVATVLPGPAGDDGRPRVEVRFATPQRAISPGQSVVFYQGDLVAGGGVIARTSRGWA